MNKFNIKIDSELKEKLKQREEQEHFEKEFKKYWVSSHWDKIIGIGPKTFESIRKLFRENFYIR